MSIISLVQSVIAPKQVEKKSFSFKEKITKEYYLMLKDKCKTHSLAAKAIRQEAIKNKGNVRRMLRTLKSEAGQEARIVHVALCFLRGRKYSEVEKNVEAKNKITADQLHKFICHYLSYKYYNTTGLLAEEIKKFLEE